MEDADRLGYVGMNDGRETERIDFGEVWREEIFGVLY